MREAIIHIPVMYNNGEAIEPEILEAIEQKILWNFNGFTKSLVTGVWKNEGRVYKEPMQRYIIAMQGNSGDIWKLRESIALEAKRLCQQESIYMVLPCGAVEFR